MLFGGGLRPLRSSTPWLALKYGDREGRRSWRGRRDRHLGEGEVVRLRSRPSRSCREVRDVVPFDGLAEYPSFVAMSLARSISMPFGFDDGRCRGWCRPGRAGRADRARRSARPGVLRCGRLRVGSPRRRRRPSPRPHGGEHGQCSCSCGLPFVEPRRKATRSSRADASVRRAPARARRACGRGPRRPPRRMGASRPAGAGAGAGVAGALHLVAGSRSPGGREARAAARVRRSARLRRPLRRVLLLEARGPCDGARVASGAASEGARRGRCAECRQSSRSPCSCSGCRHRGPRVAGPGGRVRLGYHGPAFDTKTAYLLLGRGALSCLGSSMATPSDGCDAARDRRRTLQEINSRTR